MADIAAIISATETLFSALHCPMVRDFFAKWMSIALLEDLSTTLDIIKAMLLDVANKGDHLPFEQLVMVEKIVDIVYDADDLFDHFLSLIEKKQLAKGLTFFEKVRDFFSSNNPLIVAKMSSKVKKFTKMLDVIKNNRKSDLRPSEQRIRRGEEREVTIIGRTDDLDLLVDRLVDSKAFEEDLSCLPIVGIGGLGKTALAQLAYYDERVCLMFPLRLWVRVADQGTQLDLKGILEKIIISLTRKKCDGFTMEMMQSCLGEKLEGKRFLLVLDDLWTENRENWFDLKSLLKVGGPGSMILVTTRSRETSRIVGTLPMYELQPLSQDNSWELFKRVAYYSENLDGSLDLVEIGRKIAESCYGNPLAIKVAGSLLCGQDKSKWLSVLESGLGIVGGRSGNDVTNILKLSYSDLASPLKCCFSYLALFSKDLVIDKEMLINLWMAQGYIVPFEEGQSIRDAGVQYFFILLQRFFFQDIIQDDYGEVVSCKIQSLMHDVAQQLAKWEICGTDAIPNNMGNSKIRHLYHAGGECTESVFSQTKIRSYLQTTSVHSFPVSKVIESCIHLRALDLHGSGIDILPDSIGKLLHLRYLDLSNNVRLKALPNSVTKLLNLQTLNIDRCDELKELPKDFNKLVKLQNLYVHWWRGLTYMPSGMDKLTNLRILTGFVVANKNPNGKQRVGQLKDLRALTHLESRINISIPESFASVEDDDRETGVLQEMERLKVVGIFFDDSSFIENQAVNHEALLQRLLRHSHLKGLTLWGYQGVTMWGRENKLASFLLYLVKIELRSCQGFQHLPSMSELQNLKSLELNNLRNLEYIENTSSSNRSSCAPASEAESVTAESTFFPCLEQLELVNLPKLKGWWRGMRSVDDNLVNRSNNGQPPFARISKLTIQSCHDLTSFPPCPSLVTLCLRGFNENLRIIVGEHHEGSISASSAYPSVVQCGNSNVKLKEVEIENVGYLKLLPTGSSSGMHIDWDKELESLPEAAEVLEVQEPPRGVICSSFVQLQDRRE